MPTQTASTSAAATPAAASEQAESAGHWSRSFQQCIELLKGPTDERRYRGGTGGTCYSHPSPPAGQVPATAIPHRLPSHHAPRFVGLLLATKLLPTGDDDATRAVLAALGFKFLARLLLPLSPGRQVCGCSPSTHALQQAASCACPPPLPPTQ